MGSHCRIKKYVPRSAMTIGNRKKSKKRCRGRYRPDGSGGTEKNGATPFAVAISKKPSRQRSSTHASISKLPISLSHDVSCIL